MQDVAPQLKVWVKDNSNNLVSAAAVSLYATVADWQNKSNAIGKSVRTNAADTATFVNLQAKIYYIDVRKDALNNAFGINQLSDTLRVNTLSNITIIIK